MTSRWVCGGCPAAHGSLIDAATAPHRCATEIGAVSKRTLIRRLAEAGTTYRELRDAHRRKLAIELLSETSLTAAEIAYRLGYEDASNFGKACHRWFGRSPGSLRKRLRERQRKRAPRGDSAIGG